MNEKLPEKSKEGIITSSLGAGILSGLVWGILLFQYLYFTILKDALFLAILGELYAISLFLLLSCIAWWSASHKTPFHQTLSSLLHGLMFLLCLALTIFINGPFAILLFILELLLSVLNFFAMVENIHARKLLLSDNTKNNTIQRSVKIGLLIGCLGFSSFGILMIQSTWITITVQAPNNAKTTSSYWGNPDLNYSSVSCNVTPVDIWTLQITSDRLNPLPTDFHNDTLAYVDKVFYNGSDPERNYFNYTNHAKSYPNGTIILSEALPNSTSNVTVNFRYVQNWNVLQMLQDSNATLILNAFGSFIWTIDPFLKMWDTMMFHLLNTWQIKFYLQVDVNNEYSHVFNYLNITPLANQTLLWGQLWSNFLGISFDCEQEDYPQSPLNTPGYIPLIPGQWIPETTSTWKLVKRAWYWMNEVNRTLWQNARAAYENVFRYAQSLGKQVYVVLGPSDFSEYLDNDEDYHANPTIPFSNLSNVFYGQMSYHDNDPNGQFACYRDCIEQIRQLGPQGQSILLGWIAKSEKGYSPYYSDDEIGFQRYVEDCLIAQAAGITEIFHAPIYRLQSKWGEDAIWRLHLLLNNETKRPIIIQVRQFTNLVFWDLWKNFNTPLLFVSIVCGTLCYLLVMKKYFQITKNDKLNT